MKAFTYYVSMTGYETVSGELLSDSPTHAKEQAVLLFEQSNDIKPDGTMAERVWFYSPKIGSIRKGAK